MVEKTIFATLKNNMDIYYKKGMIMVDWKSVDDVRAFRKDLNDLQKEGFIKFEDSFLAAIIKLTMRGERRLMNQDSHLMVEGEEHV